MSTDTLANIFNFPILIFKRFDRGFYRFYKRACGVEFSFTVILNLLVDEKEHKCA